MSVKKRINQKTHKDKSIRKSRRIRRIRRRLSRKSRKLMGGVKEDCLTLNNYNKKLAESKRILDDKVKSIGLGSGYYMYANTPSEREDIEFYENKIKELNKLDHCKDEKSILSSDKDDRTENCKSCNSK